MRFSKVHTTNMRWVTRYTPVFVKRWNRFAVTAGQLWRVDETYVRIRVKWTYLYRAVDRAGKTIDLRLSTRCDVVAVKAFYVKAIKTQGRAPTTSTLDGYAASHRAVREMKIDESLPRRTKLLSSQYLNNLIEQDHESIKSRVNVMLGFKGFRGEAVTISGIELMHRIRKGQFALTSVHLRDATASSMWTAILDSLKVSERPPVSHPPTEFAPLPFESFSF